jgi:signal transduction histidine kinase
VGVVLASRRPENSIGWVLLAIGVIAMAPMSSYAEYAFTSGAPGGAASLALDSWTWVPLIGLSGIFLLLLFPDGHLPSPRWRWFAWAVGVGMVVGSLGILFLSPNLENAGYPEVLNPLLIPALERAMSLIVLALATIPLGVLGAAVSLVLRYRRGDTVRRHQIRWLASAAVVVAVFYAVTMAATASTAGWAQTPGWMGLLQAIAVPLFGLLPISIGIAILKYRLFDIDIVIRKAVIATTIAAFFVAIYALIVGGVGALADNRSTLLSFVAAVVAAALFQPVLDRARRFADRVAYGKRATPYEVLTAFGDRLSDTYASDDVLPRTARILGEGVGADRAHVWLATEAGLHPVAEWTRDGVEGGAPDGFRAEVRHQGEVLGALSVAMPANDPIDPAKEKLVTDLATQAGLLLRNVRLVEDLKASRRRLVAAQDEERRKLERNIHDGAQQQLVALAVKARLARTLTGRDPSKAAEMLEQIETETQSALGDLRDLARGIYPPLLADKGLVAALEAQARKAPVPVEVRAEDVGRYPQDVEAAVYFSCLEALQNVAKYAEATGATIVLADEEGSLRFSVTDDGRGFDAFQTSYGTGLQGIADRLAAIDGTLAVTSSPGKGTTISGVVQG